MNRMGAELFESSARLREAQESFGEHWPTPDSSGELSDAISHIFDLCLPWSCKLVILAMRLYIKSITVNFKT